MADVSLDKIKKVYEGDVIAVHESSLDIEDREFMVFVGPSGCGKSTTLRMIAGLESITAGTIKIGDRVINDVPPKDRDIAMVFQNYALYPHMSIFDNMAFSLKLRKIPKAIILEKVTKVAKNLGLEEYLQRKPKALSGGQRQRVALGRAIVREPSVFLFDEPLSNLDAKMRVEMRKELLILHRSLNATIVYVTHDQIEAMTLGTRICVMSHGYIQQVGKPLDVYDRPNNIFVAKFIGTPPMNIFKGTVTSHTFSEAQLKFNTSGKLENEITGKAFLGVRPEDMIVCKEEDEEDNSNVKFKANVDVIERLGDEQLVYCNTGDNHFICKADSHIPIEYGKEYTFKLNDKKVHIFNEAEVNITKR